MDEFLKMDIFFAVATGAVVVLTVCAAFVLYRVYRILGKVEEISALVSDEGRELRADMAHIRAEIAEQGLIASTFAGVARAFNREGRKRGKKSSS